MRQILIVFNYLCRNLLTIKAGLLLRNDKESEKIFNKAYRCSFEAFKVCQKELFECKNISLLILNVALKFDFRWKFSFESLSVPIDKKGTFVLVTYAPLNFV